MYPRGESNPNRQNRNLKFYPLNYGGETDCKYNKFRKKQNYFRICIYSLPQIICTICRASRNIPCARKGRSAA